MISKENALYSIRNLWQRKSRSFLTILSIFVGIVTIFIFISFGWGLFSYVNQFATGGAADKLTVQAKGAGAPGLDDTFKLDDSDLHTVKNTLGVKEATGSYFKVAKFTQNDIIKYSFLIGTDPDKPLIWELADIKLLQGRQLVNGDMAKCVLGHSFSQPDKIFPRPYKVGDKIDVEGNKLRVVGILESVGNPQDDSQIYVTNKYMEQAYENDLSYGMILARVNIDEMDDVTARVKKNLRKDRNLEEGKEDFFVSSFVDQIESFTGALNIVVGFVLLIALISVVVSAVNTANTMITSVLERVKEIGVIKSIGARNSEIFSIFLFESSILGFIAGTLGVLVGWFFTATAGLALDAAGWGFLMPKYDYRLFLALILFAVLTGAISGVIPAWNASRLKPVDALRYE